jgi:hypothetical protein
MIYLTKTEDLNFFQQLKTIREHFEINYVNQHEFDDVNSTIYIRPSNNEGELDTLFNSKIYEYDKLIKSYINTDNDLSIAYAILLEEKYRLDKIDSINNCEEALNLYKPLVVNDKLGITNGLDIFNPDETGKEYFFKHFIFRKDYIKQLLIVLDNNLITILNLKRKAISIKLVNESQAIRIMTEISYLLEAGVLQNENLNQIEISTIRYKLFEALGLSDTDFAKGRNEIFLRKPDKRFKYIENLITDVSNKIEKIPFRNKTKKNL